MVLGHLGIAGDGWNAAVLAGALPAFAYLYGLGRIDRARDRWRLGRTASFLTGCALLVVALSPTLEDAAATGLTGHMVQHLLLGMYAPVALVLGAPVTLLLGATVPPGRRRIRAFLRTRVLRVPTNLWVVTVLNAGGVYVLYLTPLYALSARSDLVHHLVHVHFLVAGCLFAWAVAGRDPLPHRPRMPFRVLALVVGAGGHAFLAKLLYARAPSLPPDTSFAPGEIERAAQWMYYGGHLAEVVLAVALFAAWYRRATRTRVATELDGVPAPTMVTPAGAARSR